MSTREASYENCGFLITEEQMEKEFEKKYGRPYDWREDDLCDFAESLGCDHMSNLNGDIVPLCTDGSIDWSQCQPIDDDTIFVFPISAWPTLFKPAYSGKEELIADMRNRYGKSGMLPASDEELWAGIRFIAGTYWG